MAVKTSLIYVVYKFGRLNMISNKTRYALNALMLLAKHEQDSKEPVLISRLAEEGKIPQKFLEAILLELRKTGVLHSKKGKGGGYSLARPASEIFMGQIIRQMEGPIALLPCVSQMAYRKCDDCDESHCSLRVLFKEIRDTTARILDSTTLAKVVEVQDILKMKKQPEPMYFI